jgi:transcriptional regulator with XRE-family HTH domain
MLLSCVILSGMHYKEADRILSCVVARLQAEREDQGLSLKKLGAMSGIHRTTIGLIESGQRSPSFVICLRLADALGLDLAKVLKGVSAKKQRK